LETHIGAHGGKQGSNLARKSIRVKGEELRGQWGVVEVPINRTRRERAEGGASKVTDLKLLEYSQEGGGR